MTHNDMFTNMFTDIKQPHGSNLPSPPWASGNQPRYSASHRRYVRYVDIDVVIILC